MILNVYSLDELIYIKYSKGWWNIETIRSVIFYYYFYTLFLVLISSLLLVLIIFPFPSQAPCDSFFLSSLLPILFPIPPSMPVAIHVPKIN